MDQPRPWAPDARLSPPRAADGELAERSYDRLRRGAQLCLGEIDATRTQRRPGAGHSGHLLKLAAGHDAVGGIMGRPPAAPLYFFGSRGGGHARGPDGLSTCGSGPGSRRPLKPAPGHRGSHARSNILSTVARGDRAVVDRAGDPAGSRRSSAIPRYGTSRRSARRPEQASAWHAGMISGYTPRRSRGTRASTTNLFWSAPTV